jgi:hypothetical protein
LGQARLTRIAGPTLALMILAVGACGEDSEIAEQRPTSTTTPTTIPPSTTSSTTTSPSARCSASNSPEPRPQQGLPDAVADTRRAIAGAARACDYERLADLAGAGSREFSFTFGAAEDPAEFWRQGEAANRQPLRFMVELLTTPYRADLDEPPVYMWPSAFGFPSWEEVPEADRQALRPLYSEEDFRGFEGFGSYIGYRIGISSDGEWLFFVAGD